MIESAWIRIDGREHVVRADGGSLADHLAALGWPLNTRCGQRGLCKGCLVWVDGRETRSCAETLAGGARVDVRIPAASLLSHPPAVVTDFQTLVPAGRNPLFQGRLGIAADLGTTTVAVLLVELESGGVLASASGLNAQVRRGDNVLTRIQLCQANPANTRMLWRDFWRETFDPLVRRLFNQSGCGWEDVAGVVMAGNTTMLHLAAGVDPTPLGTVPFRPAFLETFSQDGEAYGLPAHVTVTMLPGLAAYVGADIVAGAVCTGIHYAGKPSLLVDMGTNGEILLCSPGGNIGCATAAGPAFEGCGLLCGTRAADGAVGRILFNGPNPRVVVIGENGAPPHGIAGSAYIDFLAEGRRAGLLTPTGRFSDDFAREHPDMFRAEENGRSFILPTPARILRVGEVDVALLLQAKAAIAAGISCLLGLRGLGPGDVDRVYLAGGFGLNLSIPNAVGCGLLPGFRPAQVVAVGNTSLGGTYLALLDRALAGEMAALKADIVELNTLPNFEDCYLDNLSLD